MADIHNIHRVTADYGDFCANCGYPFDHDEPPWAWEGDQVNGIFCGRRCYMDAWFRKTPARLPRGEVRG